MGEMFLPFSQASNSAVIVAVFYLPAKPENLNTSMPLAASSCIKFHQVN